MRVVTADQPDSPAYFTYDAVLNAKERPTLDQALAEGLTPLDARRRCSSSPIAARRSSTPGRAPTSPARTCRGSVNIGLDGSYRDLGRDAARPRAADRDRRRARVVRWRPRRGSGGSASTTSPGISTAACWRLDGRPDLVERIERITAATLAEQLAEPDPPFVLDVRAEDEVEEVLGRGQRQHPAVPAARASRRAPPRPADRRPLLERLPLVDRREPAAPRTASTRSRTSSAASAARSLCRQLDQLEQRVPVPLRPATPRRRSNQSSVSFVRPAPFPGSGRSRLPGDLELVAGRAGGVERGDVACRRRMVEEDHVQRFS